MDINTRRKILTSVGSTIVAGLAGCTESDDTATSEENTDTVDEENEENERDGADESAESEEVEDREFFEFERDGWTVGSECYDTADEALEEEHSLTYNSSNATIGGSLPIRSDEVRPIIEGTEYHPEENYHTVNIGFEKPTTTDLFDAHGQNVDTCVRYEEESYVDVFYTFDADEELDSVPPEVQVIVHPPNRDSYEAIRSTPGGV